MAPDTLAEFSIFAAGQESPRPSDLVAGAEDIEGAMIANEADQSALYDSLREMLVMLEQVAAANGTSLAVLMCQAMQTAEF